MKLKMARGSDKASDKMRYDNSFIIMLIFISVIFVVNCEKNITNYCNNYLECEYRLYGKILDNIELEGPHTTILINDSTIHLDISRVKNQVIEKYPYIDATLFSIYDEINRVSEQIKRIPQTKKTKVYFLSEYNGSLGDEEVYGLISFSRIAQNESNDQVIICYKDYGAPLVATACLVYFRYKEDEWELTEYFLIWIS